ATGVSQYGHICQSASSGALQLAHDCLSFVVQTGQTRYVKSTSALQTGQKRSRRERRSSIALISSSRSRTSSRYSGGRKSMYTSGPMYGTRPTRAASRRSHESSMRRLASLTVQYADASQKTTATAPTIATMEFVLIETCGLSDSPQRRRRR